MYGTVNELCARLRHDYRPDELITLIIWRKEDVQNVLGEENVSDETAAEIVCYLATWDKDAQHAAGVGAETLRVIADNVRRAAGRHHRAVTIAASDLSILTRAAGQHLDTGSGEDPGPVREAIRRAVCAIKR
ncbi:DUF1380 family protein [Erwinia amylovora]|uniref:DUF1380 family protein n=1 Tax=Erwinia amylovora TaxID=552 RepID=UPI0001CCB7F8|nr:DUF1380 family protein [Erwinia amylovora]CBJ48227.1 conserved hypothetical protein [Erwinia amylovora ATCC 49946]